MQYKNGCLIQHGGRDVGAEIWPKFDKRVLSDSTLGSTYL